MAIKTETATQLIARLESRPSIKTLETKLFTSLAPRDVIEISGDTGSGKTELLYHFIVRCIFPPKWKELELEGLNAGCLLIDNDYHFNLFRLITILEKKINHFRTKASVDVSHSEVAAFIKDRLRLLYVVKCSNTEQFLVTLYSLENMLASKNMISCMMIDSISAFYWMDRLCFVHQLKKLDERYGLLVSMLKKLISDYSLVLIATKQNLVKRNDSTSSETQYDFIGRHWQKFVNHHLGLSTEKVEGGKTVVSCSYFVKTEKTVQKCVISESGVEIYD